MNEAKHTPTPEQRRWLEQIATGEVYQGLGYGLRCDGGTPQKSTYLMTNRLRDFGWIDFEYGPARGYKSTIVRLTDTGRAAIALATEPR